MGSEMLPGTGSDPDARTRLVVLATSDVHGQVDNVVDATGLPYRSDWCADAKGLARVSSIATAVREEVGPERVLLLDNGDFLQGSQLDHWFALTPGAHAPEAPHPLAVAFSAAGYDAQVVGNHDFNFGLDFLDAYRRAADFPVLGANVVTGDAPGLTPYVVLKRAGTPGHPVRVGILGLTTPGSGVWDRHLLAGRVRFEDMIASAQAWVPRLRAAGADVVVLLAHAGVEGPTTYGDAAPPENPVAELIRRVPGIDVCVAGHTHLELPETWITAEGAERATLITQPGYFGHVVSRVDLGLRREGTGWRVDSCQVTTLRSRDQPDDERLLAAVRPDLERARRELATPIGTLGAPLDASEAHHRCVPIGALMQRVLAEALAARLAGTEHAGLPIVAVAAPPPRAAHLDAGPLTIASASLVQPFEGFLRGVLLTGAQLRRHLEHAARFFAGVEPGGRFDPDTMTGGGAPGYAFPDYLFDTAWGVGYDIDLTRPLGRRIRNLTWPDGRPVADEELLVAAVSGYRSNGGGAYPDIATAPVVAQVDTDLRDLLVDWIRERGTVDPATLPRGGWRLTIDGVPA